MKEITIMRRVQGLNVSSGFLFVVRKEREIDAWVKTRV